MIWVFWLIIALILAALSDGQNTKALLACAVGLVVVWLFKLTLTEPAFFVAHCMTWVLIGIFVATLGSGLFTTSGLLLVVAGVLVFPARLSGLPHEIGNLWLACSDILGVVALVLLGWPAITERLSRSDGVDTDARPSAYRDASDLADRKEV